jgi:decaprenylphospho-beta-D-erythro-pentofuranosid-2-ulose 2-reductase
MREARQSGTVAILGATSMIGREIAGVLAASGRDLILFARDVDECTKIRQQIQSEHDVKIEIRSLDVLAFDADEFRSDLQSVGPLAGTILCVGYLGDNEKAFSDREESARIMDTNFTGSAAALDVVASVMTSGYICALSSVAGDRPRRKVHTYGVAKAALNDYLDALRKRLAPKQVRVVTIKLGSVDTRMVTHRRRHPFVLSSRDAAEQIVDAAESKNGVVYLPEKWRYIMLAMRLVPEALYRRL